MKNLSWEELNQALDEFSPPARSDDPKGRKRQRIIKAATELLVRHGFRKTSVDDVARRAGVAKGTVYLYFKNKAEILLYAILEEKRHYIVRIKPALAPELPPRERLRLWIRLGLVTGTEMPLVSRLLTGDHEVLNALEEVSPELMDRAEEWRIAWVAKMIDEAAAPHRWTAEELRDRANVFIGLMHFPGLLMNDAIRRGLTIERFAGILADMVVDGMAPAPASAAGAGGAGGAPGPSGDEGGES